MRRTAEGHSTRARAKSSSATCSATAEDVILNVPPGGERPQGGRGAEPLLGAQQIALDPIGKRRLVEDLLQVVDEVAASQRGDAAALVLACGLEEHHVAAQSEPVEEALGREPGGGRRVEVDVERIAGGELRLVAHDMDRYPPP